MNKREDTGKRGRRRQMSREDALVAMADLCARSEQCASEIARKLRAKGLADEDVGWVVGELKDRNFISHTRYAVSFANDRLRFSGWGRMKIRLELRARRIESADIENALSQLDASVYDEKLLAAARRKAASLDLALYDDRVRLLRHLVARGFTLDESRDAARRVYKELKDADEKP